MAKTRKRSSKAKGGKGKTNRSNQFLTVPRGLDPTRDVHALVNPFHPKAGQTKIPDANSSNTFTFKALGRYAISSDPGGMAYHEFNPYLKNQHTYSNAALVGFNLNAAPATVNADAGDYAAISGAGLRYRIVSVGFHIFSTQSPLNAQGEIMIRVLQQSDIAANRDVGVYTDEVYRCAIKDCDLVVVPSSNGEQYQEFVAFTTAVSPSANSAYQTVAITLSGCTASTNVVTVEAVVNCEVIPEVTEIGRRLATPPASHDPHTLAAVHNTRLKMKTTSHKSTFMASLRNTLLDVASAAGGALLGHAGNAAVRGVGMLLGDNRAPRPRYPAIEID